MYRTIRSLYSSTLCSVKLREDLFTNWFNVESGVKQGDNLSPTLFSLYINELVKEINNLNLGVKVGQLKVCVLLYADAMVYISDSPEALQCMLDKMYEWCMKWRLKVNITKSQVVHFRKPRQKCTEFNFQYGGIKMDIVNEYKYLGVTLDEHMKFSQCSKLLADSGGRALSAIISKFKCY